MVAWSLDAIAAAGIPRAVVAVPPGHGAAAEEALGGAAGDFPLGLAFVEGGATRSESVRNALAAAGDVEAVVVHDAARPLATPSSSRARWRRSTDADAAIAAARVTDTIKEAGPDGIVVRTHDRARLWAIQTPQAFRAAVLRRALDVPRRRARRRPPTTPGSSSAPAARVRVVESPPANFKVTTPHDLRARREPAVLTDYHVHLRPDDEDTPPARYFTPGNAERYRDAAEERGIAELGVAEHIHRFTPVAARSGSTRGGACGRATTSTTTAPSCARRPTCGSASRPTTWPGARTASPPSSRRASGTT